jgi:hypothetical protein
MYIIGVKYAGGVSGNLNELGPGTLSYNRGLTLQQAIHLELWA